MNSQSPPDPQPRPQRASGSARLAVKPVNGRTRIATLYQEGCAKIRLPETDDHSLEAVMINTSGGLTGGDEIQWQFDIADDCTGCRSLHRPASAFTKLRPMSRVLQRNSPQVSERLARLAAAGNHRCSKDRRCSGA